MAFCTDKNKTAVFVRNGENMTEKKADKRKQRTQARLRQALINLIVIKPYDEITVQNILDEADVSRSAFYAHFHDKDELLMVGLPTDILSYGLEANGQLIPPVAPLFAHMSAGQEHLYAMMGNRAMAMIVQKSRERMVENWLVHIKRWQTAGAELTMPPPAMAHFLTGALMSLLLWWINDGMKQSAAEMDAIFQQLAGSGLHQLCRSGHF